MTGMKPSALLFTVLRSVVLVIVSMVLVFLVSPTVDPFLANLEWLLVAAVALAIPPSRRLIVRWVTTGRLRRPASGA